MSKTKTAETWTKMAEIETPGPKPRILIKSTMESDLIALDSTCSEAYWLKNLISGIPLLVHLIPGVYIHCNCKFVIDFIVSNKCNRKRVYSSTYLWSVTRVRIQFLLNAYNLRNLADCLTKVLFESIVTDLLKGVGLSPLVNHQPWIPNVCDRRSHELGLMGGN